MRHNEENMQTACVQWFNLAHPKDRELLHHSPNGGRRDAREAARFKAMGTRAGFPDLFLFRAGGGYHGLAIELKTATGRQSENQRRMQVLLTRAGYRYEVVRSFDAFKALISEYYYDGGLIIRPASGKILDEIRGL